MSTPRYVAKRVGDDYKMVRQDAQECAVCYASVAGGGFLSYLGLKRRSLPGLALALIGGGLIYRGISGQNPLEVLRELYEGGSDFDRTPSYHHDEVEPSSQVPEDEVDEASMESFPASDPPASQKTVAK